MLALIATELASTRHASAGTRASRARSASRTTGSGASGGGTSGGGASGSGGASGGSGVHQDLALWEVAWEDVTPLRQIGRGSFGWVRALEAAGAGAGILLMLACWQPPPVLCGVRRAPRRSQVLRAAGLPRSLPPGV